MKIDPGCLALVSSVPSDTTLGAYLSVVPTELSFYSFCFIMTLQIYIVSGGARHVLISNIVFIMPNLVMLMMSLSPATTGVAAVAVVVFPQIQIRDN